MVPQGGRSGRSPGHLSRRHYADGEGVAQDYAEAAEVVSQSGRQGIADGQNDLGMIVFTMAVAWRRIRRPPSGSARRPIRGSLMRESHIGFDVCPEDRACREDYVLAYACGLLAAAPGELADEGRRPHVPRDRDDRTAPYDAPIRLPRPKRLARHGKPVGPRGASAPR